MSNPTPVIALRGTVKPYGRHLIVCTGETGWPAHIETMDGFVGMLARALEHLKPPPDALPKLTACDEPSHGPGHDVVVFPDRVRYLGLSEADIPHLVDEQVCAGRLASQLRHEPVGEQYLLICGHAQRDARCGAAGPELYAAFATELAGRGLSERVRLCLSSHVGGHQYAGNVILYPAGDWYGMVTASDVPRLVAEALLAGHPLADLWRGRLGLSSEQAAPEVVG